MLKRRRTRSPSRPFDTPRYSTGPPSPYLYTLADEEGEKRGVTPFAYATPYSIAAPYVESARHGRHDNEGGSAADELEMERDEEGYDGHALSDYDSQGHGNGIGASDGDAHQQVDEDVWEGVQDDESRNVLAAKTTTTFRLTRDGITDAGEVVDVDVDEDMASEASSLPSEYPSRQPEREGSLPVYSETKAGFRIHVDEEAEAEDIS